MFGDPDEVFALSAGDPGGDVQQSVAQGFRFGLGEVTGEKGCLRPGDQVGGGHREFEPGGVDRECAGREPAEAGVLGALQDAFPASVEIRVIDFLLPYGGYLLDWEDRSGVAYLQRYTFRVLGGSRKPKLVYRCGNTPWYELISTEVSELWEVSETWAPSVRQLDS